MREPTSGGSLDIMVEQDWSGNSTVQFKIIFLNPGTDQLHQHQDYDVIIKQGDNQIFSAAAQLNQPLIHNVEGTITIPYQFEGNGDYTLEVRVFGLGFPPIPISPESAVFSIVVGAVNPAGSLDVELPKLKDSRGNVITEIAVGQQATLSTSVANNDDVKQNFTALMEVRDADGVTLHLVWLTGALPPGESVEIGALWIPDSVGMVEVRTFSVTNLTNPEILSSIKTARIVISPPEEEYNCDPSYPTLCIAPPPPDLDCEDIPYRNFRVLAPDPHGFDSEKDGFGCEPI